MAQRYRISILPRADKELGGVPALLRSRLVAAIAALADNPRHGAVEKLRGREGYRVRVGSYRVLFVIDDRERVVTVTKVGPRKDVYR